MGKRTLYGTVIVTYRCNAHCNMCDCFRDPTRPEDEITLDVIKKLPEMAFTNITGGEPFIRKDIPDIVRELYKKSDRIVISTNGYFSDRIIALCKEFPKVGIRISSKRNKYCFIQQPWMTFPVILYLAAGVIDHTVQSPAGILHQFQCFSIFPHTAGTAGQKSGDWQESGRGDSAAPE